MGGSGQDTRWYLESKAEMISLDSSSVDVVTAGQCWHWFDRPRAASEVARILKPPRILTASSHYSLFTYMIKKSNLPASLEGL